MTSRSNCDRPEAQVDSPDTDVSRHSGWRSGRTFRSIRMPVVPGVPCGRTSTTHSQAEPPTGIMRDIHWDIERGRRRQEWAGEGLNFRPDSCSQIQFVTTIGSMTQNDDEGRFNPPLYR